MKYHIPVKFSGTVEVFIPDSIPEDRRNDLAQKIALAQILATVENPDAPEDEACMEYGEEWELTEEVAGTEWDSCEVDGVEGCWELE